MTFSQKILHLRKSKGLDQINVAKQLGVTRQSMYKWESGVCMPELDKIKKMAEIYGVSYDYLLKDDLDCVDEQNKTETCQSENSVDSNGDKNSKRNKKMIIIAVTSSVVAIATIVITLLVILLKPIWETPDKNENSETKIIEHTNQHGLTLAYVYDKPTCEENGRVLMQCKEPNCDYFELIVQNPLNHDIDENSCCTRCDYVEGSQGIEYATDDGEKYYVKSLGSCTEKHIVISNKCNGKNVVAIYENAFSETDIISVKIPHGIEKIDNNAFYGCSYLENVIFGENLKIIGEKAFYNCKLKTVILPDSIEEIHRYSFYQNEINELYIGKNAKYVGSYAFYSCPISIYDYRGDKRWHGYASNNQQEVQFLLTEYVFKKWYWYDLYLEE